MAKAGPKQRAGAGAKTGGKKQGRVTRAAAATRKPAGRSAGESPKKAGRKGKLDPYYRKRNFGVTPEPRGDTGLKATVSGKGTAEADLPRFVVQMHDATRLHWDFRLEAEGVLKSWAVPKGPSLDPADKRLAVRTEDHPMDYIDFEGVIPAGEYGGGPVIVWDRGTYINIKADRKGNPIPMAKALEMGTVEVLLRGEKLHGGYALVRTRPGADGKEHWLLIKMKDEHAEPGRDVVQARPESVKSGRTIAEVLKTSPDRAQVVNKLKRASWEGAEKAADRTSGGTTKKSAARESGAAPEWMDPMLATLVEEPPARGEWIYEPKLDGFRALAFRDRRGVRLLSRNKKDLGERFPEIVEALGRQPVEEFVLDGEVVALDQRGAPSFSLLQQRLRPVSLAAAKRGKVKLYYYVFDLLYANGYDTRGLPQAERTRLLGRAVSLRGPIRATVALEGDWRALLDRACADGWEGLIGKEADCPYTAGRSRRWIKLKCLREQEFVIGGWTDPEGSRTGFGSLLVGYYEEGTLRYAGKVGTGYSERVLKEVLKQLRPLSVERSPFEGDGQIPRRGVHFTRPRLVASVAFTEWTHDDHIRHPRYRGLRDDKPAREVRRERPEGGGG